MKMPSTPLSLGELSAELFLKRVKEQGFRTSNRHLVDYLPKDVSGVLFTALLAHAHAEVEVHVPEDGGGERRVKLAAIDAGEYEVVPYLVNDSRGEDPLGAHSNWGSEGFASCLRDHYAVNAPRPRLLVVITAEGNETQKSAQDLLADKLLLTLDQLLTAVVDRAGAPPDSLLRTVAEVYRRHQAPEARWPRVVEEFERYVDIVVGHPPEEQGRRLPMLGCFLSDPTPNFSDGEPVRILEDKDQRRRQRGEGRLYDNALLREFLDEAFENPIVDPEHVLAEVFEDQPEKAQQIAQGGREGIKALDLGTFSGMDLRRQKRQKNTFNRSTLSVEGAAHHHTLGQADDCLLVVSSLQPFTVRLRLGRAFNNRKERAQVIVWDAEKSRLDPKQIPVNDGAEEIQFMLQPPLRDGFAVVRLALTRGPRTLRHPIDALMVVIYGSDAAEVVTEEARQVSLEDQAWVAEGRRAFHRYTPSGSEPVGIGEVESVDATREPEERPIFLVLLEGSSLMPRVVDERPQEAVDDPEEGRFAYEELLELACSTTRIGHRTTTALRTRERYLDAVIEVTEVPARFKVDLAEGVTREIWPARTAPSAFLYERAVARLLRHPMEPWLERVGTQWRASTDLGSGDHAAVQRFREARVRVLETLRTLAEERFPRFRREVDDAAVAITLLPLDQARREIEGYLAAWSHAVDDALQGGSLRYGSAHDALLQTDTLRLLDSEERLERLVVLPTHPWLLAAVLQLQDGFAANVNAAKESRGGVLGWRFELTREEVEQLIPRTVLDDWYLWHNGDARLLLTDSAAFHLEYLPESKHVHRKPLDYVSRVVANKVARYLSMHPHLRDERRALRIGFVNAGDGRHLLEGLEQWLRHTMREHADRIRSLPMEQIPAIDVFFFSTSADADHGAAFERFFQEQVGAADEDVIRQGLMARLRYRFCGTDGPRSHLDAVHLCFVHGLVDARQQSGRTGPLNEWWDGAFGQGLLATPLRRTLPPGADNRLHSQRGLWVDPDAQGLRGALARLLALQRGCRDSDLSRDKGIYWECSLPNVRDLATTYTHSDWVVHLDRELSLEVFRRGAQEHVPTIIEYSDQEVPESPGYDTITVTRNATPYREQLGEILTTADLDVAGRTDEARRAANAILDDINVLSGAWALDFLLGSIADTRTSMRLKGNVGATLAYRWLRRIEHGVHGSMVLPTNVGPVVPVYVSLEDLLRATPAAGLSRKGGLVYRYTNEVDDRENKEAARWCDDLLVLYLTPTEKGQPSRLFGRVVEVKFGKGALGTREKAVGQVRNTQQLLQERLAGDPKPLDAAFRHKQLSLLIKAQVEQAVAMNVMEPSVYEFLNVPALSANLATGNYTVDYTIGAEGKHLVGDAFLLHTGTSDNDQVQIEEQEGVRIITIPRPLVEWLAFDLADSPTLVAEPPSTLPRLGHYQSAVTTSGTPRHHVAPSIPVTEQTREQLASVAADPPVAHPPAIPDAPAAAHVTPAPQDAALSGEPVRDEPSVQLLLADVQVQAPPGAGPTLGLKEAAEHPVKIAPYADEPVVSVVSRLERALIGHKVQLASAPSARETDRGPRLLRAHVRLAAGESINAVRRISEDIARVVGTTTSDIHITNVPERHAIGLDLPMPGLTYAVGFDELMGHPSFTAAQHELILGFCAGIDVTGRAAWVDLATMPHMLVAGTTGSGKTVFLRNLILTLLLSNTPAKLKLRLSSSKPMDFRIFAQTQHAADREMAKDPAEAKLLAEELVQEMERRYSLLDAALCDNLAEYNAENPTKPEPYFVAVFDEYAEMVSSFAEKHDRDAFEGAIGRLAQKARAAGIHLVVCMQRPDANALKGAIKANIVHRFALKLPQNHDSRIILDESGAETLLGQGDLLYKDANSRLLRLQVPFLENATLKRCLQQVPAREKR
jgi:hypothetical protein